MWQNWAGTESCRPRRRYEPATIEELREVLAAVAKQQPAATVRIVGCGHSPNDVACSDGVHVSLRRMNAVLDVNDSLRQVQVQAGATLGELCERLQAHSLTMPALPAICELTVGGVLSTGVHGSARDWPSFATLVVSLQLMDAQGRLWACSRTENEEIFFAALCSFGSVGVIVSATLQCIPKYSLRQLTYTRRFEIALNDLPRLRSAYDTVRLWFIPHTDTISITTQAVVAASTAPTAPMSWFRAWLDRLLTFHLMHVLLFVSLLVPRLRRLINRFYTRIGAFGNDHKPEQVVGDSMAMSFYECRFRQYVNEWALPAERAAEALRAIRTLIDNNGGGAMHCDLPIEVRFVRGDDLWLSPCFGRDSVFIGVIAYRPYGYEPRDWRRFFVAFDELMASLGGRPHWAKCFFLAAAAAGGATATATATQCRLPEKNFWQRRYPHWSDWLRVRQRLDPSGLFVNAFVRRLLDNTTTTTTAVTPIKDATAAPM